MNETEFLEKLRAEGFEGPEDFIMGPNEVDEEHAHDTNTIGLVVEGSIVIEKTSGDISCGVGDTVYYPAGELHSEKAGPNGVKALVGWREPIEKRST